MLRNLYILADLIKYKLSLAVVLSSLTGYYLFHNTIDHRLFILAAGIFLLSSGSVALNQYTERTADSTMERTKNRPIPSKNISESCALLIALILLLFGGIFLFINGLIPFILGIINILLYNLFYTRLKKTTLLAIIPGALAGAFPPVIGFSSAGGTLVQMNIFAFVVFMFLWQLPHFWMIIIKYGAEYKAAGFATISNYLNEKQIRYLVFFWIVFTSGLLFLFFLLTAAFSKGSLILLLILNLAFIFVFYRLLFLKKGSREIKGAFILINSFSVFIMFLLIAASIIKGI